MGCFQSKTHSNGAGGAGGAGGVHDEAKAEENTQLIKQEANNSRKIEKTLQHEKTEQAKIIKLLLLGAGESGKSTIFKQMQILYNQGFPEEERKLYRHILRSNATESIQALITGIQKCNFHFSSEEAKQSAAFLSELDPLSLDFWTKDIVVHIKNLWGKDEAIAKMYEERSKLQIPDSAKYMFENIDRIGQDDFIPSAEDVLRARWRTSGIVEKIFRVNGTDIKFIDVGGQRNERRKWIHCFENVTAVIFVAAISEYDQLLYEDQKVNRLQETLMLFDNISNSQFFKQTAMILFLNKIDLFAEKIAHVPFKNQFPDFTGNNTVEECAEYIQNLFLKMNKSAKQIFPFFTCATDTTQFEKVFVSCRRIILKNNLQSLGLVGAEEET